MCVEDHKAAAQWKETSRSRKPTAVSKTVYDAAWERIPSSELCELVSDDALTLMALLLSGKALRPFTYERLGSYLKGRVPWGYTGNYPDGRWLIL